MGRVWIRIFTLPHKSWVLIIQSGILAGTTTGLQSLNKDFQAVASMVRLAGDERAGRAAL